MQLVQCSPVQSNISRDCLIRSKYRPARSHVRPVRLASMLQKLNFWGSLLRLDVWMQTCFILMFYLGPTRFYQLSLADTDVHYIYERVVSQGVTESPHRSLRFLDYSEVWNLNFVWFWGWGVFCNWKVLKFPDLPKFKFSRGGGYSVTENWKVLKCQDLPKFNIFRGGGYSVTEN